MKELSRGVVPAVMLSMSLAHAAAAAPAPKAPEGAAPAVIRSLFSERQSKPAQLKAFENKLRLETGLWKEGGDGGCDTTSQSDDGSVLDCDYYLDP